MPASVDTSSEGEVGETNQLDFGEVLGEPGEAKLTRETT